MLTLIDQAGPFQLPTGWYAVSTRQLLDLDRLDLRTVEARASYFAGRPVQVNEVLADALAFLLTPPSAVEELPDHGQPADLGQASFYRVESIRALLVLADLPTHLPAVLALLTDEQMPAATVLALPVTRTWPLLAFALAELQRLAEKYAALAEPDLTAAGRRAAAAGADRLAIFGHYNTAVAYAQAFSLSVEAAYATPWESVALWLYRERVKAEIEDTLQAQSATHPE